MFGIARTFRASVAGGLSVCLALSGLPVALLAGTAAEAANASIIRIQESGPGARKSVKLGLNKAIVLDLPSDAHDILVADPVRFGDGLLPTFWEAGTGERADHRAPLASRYRTRYLNGGPFTGGTELLLWTAHPEWLSVEPQSCQFTGAGLCHALYVERFDEAGNADQPLVIYDGEWGGPVSSRLRVGSDRLPVGDTFGQLEIRNQEILGCFITPFGSAPQQAFVSPVHSASGQFSVGLSAIATESYCDPLAE